MPKSKEELEREVDEARLIVESVLDQLAWAKEELEKARKKLEKFLEDERLGQTFLPF